MIVIFVLLGIYNDVEIKLFNYVSYLFGDEGEGSLLVFLK